jgi:hypothetical protein
MKTTQKQQSQHRNRCFACFLKRIESLSKQSQTSIRSELDIAFRKRPLLQDETALDAAASNGMLARQGGKAPKQ